MIGIADMINNLCTKCDGRGFEWQHVGHIQDRDNGQLIADLRRMGDVCQDCKGTGRCDNSAKLMLFFAGLVALFFFAIYFGAPLFMKG